MATINALPPSPTNADNTLSDPTGKARLMLFGLIAAAFGLAALMNWRKWTGSPFAPAQHGTANFALFAGFYVAAQIIERLMVLVSPLLPFWKPYDDSDAPAVKAAHVRADRAPIELGIAAVLGVAASCGFGLFFLRAVGMDVAPTIDTFCTGVTIAAGTKPLHDFIGTLQNQTTPSTGTGV
jgi:hypothetical protein